MYWPMAIVSISGRMNTLYTGLGEFTVEEAQKQIESWKKNEQTLVYFAYIHDDDLHIVYYENNIDVSGQIDYDRAYKCDFSQEANDSKGQKGV